MQRTEAGRSPGLVSSAGMVPITFKMGGNPNLIRQLSKGFEPALKALLASAGYAGTFNVFVQTTIKGTPHTKGLRVLSPERHGVAISWHEGSNDNCIRLSISAPRDTDAFAFHSRLKRAEATDDDEPADTPASGKIVDFRKPGFHPTPPASFSDQIVEANGKKDSTEPAPAIDGIPFVDDPANIELFMLEIRLFLDDTGRVRRSVCQTVLQQTHFADQHAVVITQLLEREHLRPTSEPDLFQVSVEWLRRLQEKPATAAPLAQAPTPTPPPAPAPVAQPTPLAVAATVAAQAGAEPRKSASNGSGNPALNALAGLQQKAKTAGQLRARLGEVDGEIAQIDQQMAGLQSLKDSALERRARIQRSLEAPEMAEAERNLAQIKELLKL